MSQVEKKVLLFYEMETATRAKVRVKHHQPETLTDEARAKGILVNETSLAQPSAEMEAKQSAVMYVDPTTGVTWFEYVPRRARPEELLADLLVNATEQLALLTSQAAATAAQAAKEDANVAAQTTWQSANASAQTASADKQLDKLDLIIAALDKLNQLMQASSPHP